MCVFTEMTRSRKYTGLGMLTLFLREYTNTLTVLADTNQSDEKGVQWHISVFLHSTATHSDREEEECNRGRRARVRLAVRRVLAQ